MRKKAAVGSNKRKTRSPSKSKKTPPATPEDAGLYSSVRIKMEDGVPVEDFVPDVATYRKYFEEAKGLSKLFDDSEDSSESVDTVFSPADDSDSLVSSAASGGTTGSAEEVKRPARTRRPTERYEH